MILYFSATGNSKYVAEELAKRTGDYAVSMMDCVKTDTYQFILQDRENLGFVFPTYFLGLPTVVIDYLRKLKTNHDGHYIFFAASYGTSPGASHIFAEKALKDSGIKFNACYSIRMPDTWTPEFDLSNADEVKALNDAEMPQINEISKNISAHQNGDFMKKKTGYFITNLSYWCYNHFFRKAKHFNVENSCIGCGLCQQKCPTVAIEMQNGKPVWIKEKCTMCLGCLHRCPKFSIQYGKKTKGHGQYRHPNIII